MSQEIVVPLDGSRFAEYALPFALSIAERSSARVRLVSAVTDVPPLPVAYRETGEARGWFDEARSRSAEYLEALSRRVREAAPEIEVQTQVLVGPAVRTIVEEIGERDPALVVMTTHGRGPLQRAWVGSVTDGLLRRSPAPLFLVRPRERGEADLSRRPGFDRILIPLDGSKTAEAVLRLAREFGDRFSSRFELLTVLPPLFPVGSTYLPHLVEEAQQTEERKASFQAYLDDTKEALRSEGVEVRARVVEADDVATGVLEEAEREEIDLVAMSSHGRSGVSRLVLGSVADKVIRGVNRPVLLLKAEEEA